MKLTDTQLVVLSAAAARSDGAILPLPPHLKGGAIAKVCASLLAKGLAIEIVEGGARTLVITVSSASTLHRATPSGLFSTTLSARANRFRRTTALLAAHDLGAHQGGFAGGHGARLRKLPITTAVVAH